MSISMYGQLRKPSHRTHIILASLFVICLASLLLSYLTSKAFRYEFGGLHFNPETPKDLVNLRLGNLQGALIEFIRVIFFLIIAYYYFGSRFRDEFKIIFCFSNTRHPSLSHRHFYRILAAVSILIISYFVIVHHLKTGPLELKERFESHLYNILEFFDLQIRDIISNRYTTYVRPYKWYLPYSLIVYVVLVVPFFVVGLFRIDADWKELRSLRARITHATNSTIISSAKFLKIYEGFFQEFVGFCGRYIHFLFFLCLAISFEAYVGQYTLTSVGANWAVVGYALAGIFATAILIAMVLYSRDFERSHDWIRENGGNFVAFTENFCPFKLMKHLLKTYTFLFWSLFILGGVVPFMRILLSLLV